MKHTLSTITTAIAPEWSEYELIDTGDGMKLERFGKYQFVRPEPQAMWRRTLAQERWEQADAVFADTGQEQGKWKFRTPMPERWNMTYGDVSFWAQATPFRHLGVFPEQGSQWQWMQNLVQQANRPVQILNLFGYTGIASLVLAKSGAKVTHVDASKKIVSWASDNQKLSNLTHAPIRWIVDDALKFVQREERRGVRYDGIILDPPKFGRGPKGEVWKLEESLRELLIACRMVLTPTPLFVALTAYAIRTSALSLGQTVQDVFHAYGGDVAAGELVTREQSSGKLLSHALFTHWQSHA